MTDKSIDARIGSHAFGNIEVLRHIQLEVSPNEIVAIVGPSGCGKTTLLNLLSGTLNPSNGTISREGPTRTVYQQDGLLPWLTMAGNIDLGLRHLTDSKARSSALEEALAMIGLQTFRDHYPYQVSGGMRQRAELARALVSQARILLLDEPFSALDYMTRLHMRHEFVRLMQNMPRTVLLVTHDVEEAVELADRVLVLTRRPTTILDELRMRSPRPRHVTDPEVVATVGRLLSLLNLETPFTATGPHADHADRIPIALS